MTFTAVALTPMARTRSSHPAFEPTPASLALKMRRVELGKSQADVAFDSEVLTQTTVSELERGKYGPEDLTAARLASLARGLNWSVAELEKATGLNLGLGIEAMATHADSTKHTRAKTPQRARPLPQGLQDAIDAFGKRFPDLLDAKWQQYLAGFQWRRGIPEDPTAWLDLYRDLDRAGVVPGEE